MLYQVNKPALTPYGRPLMDEGEGTVVTLAILMFTALISTHKDDEKLSIVQKRNIYRLKERLVLAGDEDALQMELSAEDVALIRQRAAQSLVIDLFGQIDDFLENPLPVGQMVDVSVLRR